jgi:hypothetical protein
MNCTRIADTNTWETIFGVPNASGCYFYTSGVPHECNNPPAKSGPVDCGQLSITSGGCAGFPVQSYEVYGPTTCTLLF